MDKTKKNGGIIKNWQIHTLTITPELALEKYDVKVDTDKCYVLTGTTVDEPTGRWNPGDHMRSSVIVNIDYDTGIVETQSTIYQLEGDGNSDVLPDLGDGVCAIFY